MVLEGKSELSIPSLRGNPFDGRPIESSRVNEIVGRDELLSSWAELIRSGSPRMLLLIGDKGSGKTSVINAVSTTTSISTVCQYWPEDDQLIKVLHEISVSLEGFEISSTVHQISESLVNSLESKSGPLPVIALDFPSNVDMGEFLPRIMPIMQRLRAFIIVSLTPSQFSSLDSDILDIFDFPVHLNGLEKNKIQSLVDKRVMKKAKQRWLLSPKVLQLLYEKTLGNPRSLVNTLQNLVDEYRGVGAFGSLDKLLGWENQNNVNFEKEKEIIAESENIIISEEDNNYDHNEEILDEEDEKTQIQEIEILEKVSTENNDFTLINWSEDFEKIIENEDVPVPSNKSFEAENLNSEIENKFEDSWKEEEMPKVPSENSNKGNFGAFGAMIARSRELPVNDHNSEKTFHEEYIDASVDVAEENLMKNNNFSEDIKPTNELNILKNNDAYNDKLVVDTEGEVWTVDQENEQTLPSKPFLKDSIAPDEKFIEETIIDEPIFEQIIIEEPLIEPNIDNNDNDVDLKSNKTTIILSPKWDADNSFDLDYASQLSDTESIIISKAMEREISPSDSELQALLQVGRPRLSQIYNSLNKAGILSVRKKGRSRFFKISESAKSYF